MTQTVGINLYSSALGLIQPETHILGEIYCTSAALRYGDYIAKLSVTPVSASLQLLIGKRIDTQNVSVLRDLIVEFFRQWSTEYELRVQSLPSLDEPAAQKGTAKHRGNARLGSGSEPEAVLPSMANQYLVGKTELMSFDTS